MKNLMGKDYKQIQRDESDWLVAHPIPVTTSALQKDNAKQRAYKIEYSKHDHSYEIAEVMNRPLQERISIFLFSPISLKSRIKYLLRL
jgi:hypothetical protein